MELKSPSGQLVLLWNCEIGMLFCRVWCTNLIGLSPILAVTLLRVNTLSPFLTSLSQVVALHSSSGSRGMAPHPAFYLCLCPPISRVLLIVLIVFIIFTIMAWYSAAV